MAELTAWANEDGSTNVEGFLEAYARDDNTFWRAELGHIQNVLDELIDRIGAHVRVDAPNWDTKVNCKCGEKFTSIAEWAFHRFRALDGETQT